MKTPTTETEEQRIKRMAAAMTPEQTEALRISLIQACDAMIEKIDKFKLNITYEHTDK